jgi:hypothetical protein
MLCVSECSLGILWDWHWHWSRHKLGGTGAIQVEIGIGSSNLLRPSPVSACLLVECFVELSGGAVLTWGS